MSMYEAIFIRWDARLFHMLTGRPPFPGGTVLQKLIQHQEEAPADVRTLNPAVPVELAAIITRLMAKDRDRRYQTPEHLVRELLGIAGIVGLAPPSAAGGRVARARHIDRRGSRTWCGWCRSWASSWWSMVLAWWGREPTRRP